MNRGCLQEAKCLRDSEASEIGCLNMELFTQMGVLKIGSEALNFGGKVISLRVMKLI